MMISDCGIANRYYVFLTFRKHCKYCVKIAVLLVKNSYKILLEFLINSTNLAGYNAACTIVFNPYVI